MEIIVVTLVSLFSKIRNKIFPVLLVLLKGFENKGWQGTGIEPNASMAEYGKKIVGVNVITGTIETIKLEEKYDLIIIIQVIAHINNISSSINTMLD